MLHRHAISDESWNRIKDFLPGRAGCVGAPAEDNRLFVDAVLWIAKTGAPWRDLPERFGKFNSVWRRFDRWGKMGIWKRVYEELRDPDVKCLILDSTVIRAHQHAAGAQKKRTGPAARRSRRWGGAAAGSAPRST